LNERNLFIYTIIIVQHWLFEHHRIIYCPLMYLNDYSCVNDYHTRIAQTCVTSLFTKYVALKKAKSSTISSIFPKIQVKDQKSEDTIPDTKIQSNIYNK